MDQKTIIEIFKRLQKNNPDPTTELNYTTPFELLIATILSAQATDVSVNKVTKILFPMANTPEKIFALGEEGLKKYIKTIGLYHAKALNIIKTCRMLIDKHNSQVPNKREDLEALAGVGRKTANIILSIIFGEPTVAVDTHVFRVANRTNLASAKTRPGVEKALLKCIPKEFLHNAHHWLVLHGRYTCIARRPRCPSCIISDLCEYPDKTED